LAQHSIHPQICILIYIGSIFFLMILDISRHTEINLFEMLKDSLFYLSVELLYGLLYTLAENCSVQKSRTLLTTFNIYSYYHEFELHCYELNNQKPRMAGLAVSMWSICGRHLK
ncbi:hypothetical protein, partial [Enterobacter sp. PN108E5IIB]|uniref:hypothetical protein n=1 Tax=Enterobacter sp. PN108E5IIB TaxID=2041080 RepID=UPI000D588B89